MQGSMLIKVESSIIQTVFWGQQMLLYAIVVQEDLENLLLQICLQRITAKDAIQKKCFPTSPLTVYGKSGTGFHLRQIVNYGNEVIEILGAL